MIKKWLKTCRRMQCTECHHDIPRTDDCVQIICAGCANKMKLNALKVGEKHTSIGHLGPSLEEY